MNLLSRDIPLAPGMFHFMFPKRPWCDIAADELMRCLPEYPRRFLRLVGSIADEFYALFYLGLYCEARGETSKAALYMPQAAATEYATGAGRGDYMTTCARIHCNLRGWTPKK